MDVIYLLLYLAAAICFLLGALPDVPVRRVNLVALGLLFWVAVYVIKTALGLPG